MSGPGAGDGAHVARDKSMAMSTSTTRFERVAEAFASVVEEVPCR